MIESKIIFAVIATILGLIGYIPYISDIFKGKTKPHIFSWFIWGLLTAIGFLAQVVGGAGPGAWVTGVTALICFLITALAFNRGEKNITRGDWFCFVGALFGIVLWVTTDNPLSAVILITIIDAVAYIPTFRKAYHKPFEETLIEYILSSLKFVVALFALDAFTLVTALYPVSLVITNGAFAIMVIVRRGKLGNPK
jgi:predicted neutral ceramidase superfamily lipid hydrolase